ncbi:MAG: hypothetical protein EU530_00765 [Promethearchaeota archaeon]|nr:MAG: hypothetical protein EU530_00765 [Candidatus Lokiarchaeota archaeon]
MGENHDSLKKVRREIMLLLIFFFLDLVAIGTFLTISYYELMQITSTQLGQIIFYSLLGLLVLLAASFIWNLRKIRSTP